jgi:V8-like Glu-specific endopeptidase
MSLSGRTTVGTLAVLTTLLLSVPGCSPDEVWTPPAELYSRGAGIVGGSETSAWPAVGAYLIDGGYGGMCTATLVAPDVALTAAHCVDYSGSGDLFYVGADINTATGADVHAIDDAIAHPNYNWHQSPYHDVAVLLLSQPIDDVDPMPVNTEPMSQSWVGDLFHYVGFGVNDYYQGNNAGIKRETDIALYEIYSHEYVHWTQGTNVCSGDSGGPSMVDHGGVWHVAGINSFVGATEHGQDACHGVGVEMRVDADMDFFDDYFDPELPGDDDDAADDDDSMGDDDTAGDDDDMGDDDAADDDDMGDDDAADDDDAWVDPGGEVSLSSGCECAQDRRATAGPTAALALLAGFVWMRRRD